MTVRDLPAMPPPPDLSGTPWRAIWLSERREIWCLVDAEDFDWLSGWNWNISWGSRTPWQVYAKRNTGVDRATVRMHREIMLHGEPLTDAAAFVVDHINGQTLDNRRRRNGNLRWATPAENRANTRRRLTGLIKPLPEIVAELLKTLPAVAPELEEVPF